MIVTHNCRTHTNKDATLKLLVRIVTYYELLLASYGWEEREMQGDEYDSLVTFLPVS